MDIRLNKTERNAIAVVAIAKENAASIMSSLSGFINLHQTKCRSSPLFFVVVQNLKCKLYLTLLDPPNLEEY